ncbi:MAG TPA: S41 family peptidase, partial [Phaeodactylibacter sp.]|nr:S41 family peptidase [Phaeodactylibacter sp.]
KGKVIDWDRSFKTLNKPVDENIPLVVLINKGSASASEIVSGVIQDLDRGVLIGQRSYGKGLVQNTRDVGYNSKVKMTTAKYYIPSGRCIQGVSYSDGTPIDIPDSERTAFKTRNNRTVLDGGGIKPDIVLEEHSGKSIIKSLKEKHLIFDFVTEYCIGKESIPPVEVFNFTDFDAFVHFLKDKDYHYETETEKLLKKITQKASSEKLLGAIESEIADLKNKIHEEKKSELHKNKEHIIDLIEKEIASRYYFQKGKIKMSLKNDLEIEKAIEVLSNANEYKKMLGK